LLFGDSEVKFVADSMLGKLAKWLRVLGYDTHYESYYRPGEIDRLVAEGRTLLSRHKKRVDSYSKAILLCSNDAGGQLAELREKLGLNPDRLKQFSRCLICNVILQEAVPGKAKENVPEYVFYENMSEIRFCPSCGRYYWPGSHRLRMARKLREWGLG
jgi:uncharacterized protein with PIN domain